VTREELEQLYFEVAKVSERQVLLRRIAKTWNISLLRSKIQEALREGASTDGETKEQIN
jgi:hypothetical protein